jgi:stage V sporulation protein S
MISIGQKFAGTRFCTVNLIQKVFFYLFLKSIFGNYFTTILNYQCMEGLKVSAKSSPNSVAGALAGVLREKGAAEIQAIGAGAINQAVKAIAIARGFVAPSGMDLICIPAFTDIMIDGEERTAIKLIIEPR